MLYIRANLFNTDLPELEPHCSKSSEETMAVKNDHDYTSLLQSVSTNGNLPCHKTSFVF